ncbi:recombinase family protein [Streptosporangium sp. NPDC002721]|uniref:recombinase family protein n=1 Tax=Streptosporangium sp. NPDC002721 TaxID=3366188 RepID=UPI0036893C26
MTGQATGSVVPRWVLYGRAATFNHVAAQMSGLRDYARQAGGTVVAECSDVGAVGPGREALEALVAAGVVDRVLVVDRPRLGRDSEDLAQLADLFARASKELVVLEDLQPDAAIPYEQAAQIRAVSGDPLAVGDGADPVATAPLWWHDGGLSLLRGQMQVAQARLAEVEGDSPPGFGVPPALASARAEAARAEAVFAARLLELRKAEQ